jgi:K+-sensing histidine kinase KdpD
VLFIAAVIVSSRWGGVRAGVSAGLLSVIVFDWFFDATPHILDFTLAGLVQVVVFGSVSLLVASLERQRVQAIWSVEEANRKLIASLHEIKILRGILPICSYCKRIRSEEEAWAPMETYIHEHSEADFSHTVCPDCLGKHFPDIYERRYGPAERK